MVLGVLSLQGDYELHVGQLKSLNVDTIKVKTSNDLINIDGLIIPGGESTTISLLIDKLNLRKALEEYCSKKCVFGTCAGLIMISNIKDKIVKPLNLISFDLERNAYGRQIDSFTKYIDLEFDRTSKFVANFIRAPKIKSLNDDDTEVLAYDGNTPILVKRGNLLGSSFHPEIGNDNRIHKYFLKMINNEKV